LSFCLKEKRMIYDFCKEMGGDVALDIE
jgi:hypothetical protein